MEAYEIIITLILVLGFGYLIYLFLRDPGLALKNFLRTLKSLSLGVQIISFPIWGPVWLLDYLFGWNLFNEDLDKTAKFRKIKFTDYCKYILIDTENLKFIAEIVNSFKQSYDPQDFDFKIDKARFKYATYKGHVVLKVENEIRLNSFNVLVRYIDNSAPKNRVYHVKGILWNNMNRADSFFCYVDTAYSSKLIGKTYYNKKMYVDFAGGKASSERYYLNSNIHYFRNFNFDKFRAKLKELKFNNLDIVSDGFNGSIGT